MKHLDLDTLTAYWYELMIDHHKDRDCHWYIQKSWSYGEPPVYVALHYGYILDDVISPKFPTAEQAQSWLIDFLLKAVFEEVCSLLDRAANDEWDLKLNEKQVQRFEEIKAAVSRG